MNPEIPGTQKWSGIVIPTMLSHFAVSAWKGLELETMVYLFKTHKKAVAAVLHFRFCFYINTTAKLKKDEMGVTVRNPQPSGCDIWFKEFMWLLVCSVYAFRQQHYRVEEPNMSQGIVPKGPKPKWLASIRFSRWCQVTPTDR